MTRNSSIFTIWLLLLAALLALASCAPTHLGLEPTAPSVTTSPAVTTAPNQPSDDNNAPAIGKTTIEFSIFSNGPALVTYDIEGRRIGERFEDGSLRYTYTEEGALSAITLEMGGEEFLFACQYDENGLPTKAVCQNENVDMMRGAEIVFAYDEGGKLTEMSYQAEGENAYSITYGEGGMIEQIVMYGGAVLTPVYDDESYMTKASIEIGDTLFGEYTYAYSDSKQLIEIVTYGPTEEGLELQCKIAITHTESGHLVTTYEPNEEGELKKEAERLYGLDWGIKQESFYDQGVFSTKWVYSVDENGNQVDEQYVMNETSELLLYYKLVTAKAEDGSDKWKEEYALDDKGKLFLETKSIYAEEGEENYTYDSNGRLVDKSIQRKDEDGNWIVRYYELRSGSDELYFSFYNKYDSKYDLLESEVYDEAGELVQKTLRRDREEGGFYLDYYDVDENGEMFLFFTEAYDEDGMWIPPQPPEKPDGGSAGETGGEQNPDQPDPNEGSIQNGGANTESGWGPVQK